MGSYVLVTPARDESDVMADLVHTVRAQELRPRLWLILDDGSQDDTPRKLDEVAQREPWIHVVRGTVASRRHEPSRYAAVLGAAFRRATEIAEGEGIQYDYVANLDADVRCPPELLAELVSRSDRDRMVGIASCAMTEVDEEGQARPAPSPLVESRHALRRGLRLWRRDCLEEVAYYPSPSWAAVTTVRAQNRGWKTVVHPDLEAEVVRADGQRSGFWRGYRRLGQEQWHIGLHPALVAAEALRASARDRDLRGLALVSGYLESALRGQRQTADPEVRSFFHRELPREALLDAARRFFPSRRR
jgi:glycosyltransferase involved in cell wall biosynthesis